METTCHVEGKKKCKSVFLLCKAGSCRSDLDTSDRFVKYVAQHPGEGACFGHAVVDRVSGVAAGMAQATALADAVGDKKVCSTCGHKTAKDTCKKCGSSLVVVVPSNRGGGRGSGDASRSHQCVALDGRVLSEGIVDQTDVGPCDAPLFINSLVNDVCCACDLALPRLQPSHVADEAVPRVEQCLCELQTFFSELGARAIATDHLIRAFYDAVDKVEAITAVKEIVVVGLLLATRSQLHELTDVQLIEGCRKFESYSRVMQRFIVFLEDELHGEDDEEEA